jgi:hypothetical protein
MATNTGNDESCNPIFDDTMSLLSDEVESLISLNKDHTLQQPQTENIITSNSGVVYRLPANPLQFTSSKYEKQYVLLYFIESLFFLFHQFNHDFDRYNKHAKQSNFRQGSIPTLASSSASDISTSSLLSTTSHHTSPQKTNDKEINAVSGSECIHASSSSHHFYYY